MKINAKTKLFGIIGYPVEHSFSPAMHNAGFDAIGFNAVYLAFSIKNILNLKYSMKQFGISGLSVTIPHKIKIKRVADQIDALALQIGSINTLCRDSSDLLTGYNSDGPGAVEALERAGVDLRNKKIMIIGSGGSARAIAFSLLEKMPSEIGIAARNSSSLYSLARGLQTIKKHPVIKTYRMGCSENQIRFKSGSRQLLHDPEQIKPYDIIIQTTPMGMSGYKEEKNSPLTAEYLFSHQSIFDIVYNPEVTPFVSLGLKKKLNIVPGYKMLLYQGVRQFELFTGQKAPIDIMEEALLKELKK